MRGSCKAQEEKRKKKFVGPRLRVTPKSWLTPKRWLLIWNFVVFSTCASRVHDDIFWKTFIFLREPLVYMMEKVIFSSFFNVFSQFQPCERMHKHAFAGWNTQQTFFMLAWTNNFPQRTIVVTVCRPSNISPVVKSIVILRLINLLMWRRPLIITIQVSLYFSLNGVNKFPVHEGWLYNGGGGGERKRGNWLRT